MSGFFSLNELAILRKYDTPFLFDIAEYFVLAILAFSVPILFAHSQPLVGPIVNFLLIMAAINTTGWRKIIFLITLPSLSVLAGGAMFGTMTPALLFMAPFIWISNAILVFVFKALYVAQRKNYFLTLAAASLLKAGFLFAAAFALYSLSAVPALFLTAMGIMQLATAIAGGLIAVPANLAYKKFFG